MGWAVSESCTFYSHPFRPLLPGKQNSSLFALAGKLAEKEIEGVRAKCIPRKHRAVERREANAPISRSTLGSKRINDEPQEEQQ
ncbi:hypothetical protein B296_00026998 [Ensete ventricosum]|uniref:Uncharacterized protein n=1 Tax=Ensete ventricosum TaxID=4639 RepID=A0A427A1V9_ENSVE|nr:hypothetical protein B296_00026998 [Ensete ventricosum]